VFSATIGTAKDLDDINDAMHFLGPIAGGKILWDTKNTMKLLNFSIG